MRRLRLRRRRRSRRGLLTACWPPPRHPLVSGSNSSCAWEKTFVHVIYCARVVVYATSLTDSAPSPELGEKPCAIQRPGASPANETLIAALLCFVRERQEYQPEGPNVKPTHDSGVGSRIQPWGFSPPCHFMYFSVGEGGRAIFPKSLRVFRLLVASLCCDQLVVRPYLARARIGRR